MREMNFYTVKTIIFSIIVSNLISNLHCAENISQNDSNSSTTKSVHETIPELEKNETTEDILVTGITTGIPLNNTPELDTTTIIPETTTREIIVDITPKERSLAIEDLCLCDLTVRIYFCFNFRKKSLIKFPNSKIFVKFESERIPDV